MRVLRPRLKADIVPAACLRHPEWLLQDGGSPFDGLVLMCTAKSAYVGRVLPEGRLVLLHNMPRPPDTPQVLLPQAKKSCFPGLARPLLEEVHWVRELVMCTPLTGLCRP